MNFPLTISDIGLWLAVMAIILLITSELLTSSTHSNYVIDKKQFRLVALALGISFMVTVAMRIFQTI